MYTQSNQPSDKLHGQFFLFVLYSLHALFLQDPTLMGTFKIEIDWQTLRLMESQQCYRLTVTGKGLIRWLTMYTQSNQPSTDSTDNTFNLDYSLACFFCEALPLWVPSKNKIIPVNLKINGVIIGASLSWNTSSTTKRITVKLLNKSRKIRTLMSSQGPTPRWIDSTTITHVMRTWGWTCFIIRNPTNWAILNLLYSLAGCPNKNNTLFELGARVVALFY
jgi:hypothetical protein